MAESVGISAYFPAREEDGPSGTVRASPTVTRTGELAFDQVVRGFARFGWPARAILVNHRIYAILTRTNALSDAVTVGAPKPRLGGCAVTPKGQAAHWG